MPRTSAGTRHIRGIDGLRALAAFAVVAHHVGFDTGATFRSSMGAVLARLDIGVPIFFAISGYLIARPFVAAIVEGASLPGWRSFWWRRFLRIYPAYWAVLTILVYATGLEIASFYQAVMFYGLFQIYDGELALRGMVQAWTLCTEVSFYVALPLMAAGARWVVGGWARPESRIRGLLVGCGLLYLVGPLWRLYCYTAEPSWARAGLLWLPGQIEYFAIGMAVAVVAVAARRGGWAAHVVERLVARPGLWFLGALAAFALVCSLGLSRTVDAPGTPLDLSGGEAARQLLYGVVALLLLVPLALARRPVGSARVVFSTRAAAFLGVLSYGVYLWHKDLVRKAQNWAGDGLFEGNFWQIFAIVAVASTFLAWLTYLAVEKPAMALARPRKRREVATPGDGARGRSGGP